jgi:hypothetical protein
LERFVFAVEPWAAVDEPTTAVKSMAEDRGGPVIYVGGKGSKVPGGNLDAGALSNKSTEVVGKGSDGLKCRIISKGGA